MSVKINLSESLCCKSGNAILVDATGFKRGIHTLLGSYPPPYIYVPCKDRFIPESFEESDPYSRAHLRSFEFKDWTDEENPRPVYWEINEGPELLRHIRKLEKELAELRPTDPNRFTV